MPPPAEPTDRIARSVSQLDAARYQVRETAQGELTRLAHLSRPALLAAARTELSPEMRTAGRDAAASDPRPRPNAGRASFIPVRRGAGADRHPERAGGVAAWSAGPPGETLADARRGPTDGGHAMDSSRSA